MQRDRDAAGVILSTNGVPMALTVKFQVNPQAKPFITTTTACERLESRRGKRNTEGADFVSTHKILPRRGGSVGGRGAGGPNLARETTKSGENGNKGQEKRLYIEKRQKHQKKNRRTQEEATR